jgi:hypothetical protein
LDDDWASDSEDLHIEPWHGPGETPEEQPWLVSATDLLIHWGPEPAVQSGQLYRGPDLWDRYFQPTRPKPLDSFAPPASVEELWNSRAAEAAVDCLFRFIHALERGDMEEAMSCVSEEYHTFEDDCEFDATALRLRLEALIDVWRGQDVQLSLSEVPDPVFHPSGILIQITLQVDYRSKILGRRNTELIPGVAIFQETSDSRWLIAALAPVS